ncbi:unnamed protein product [Paramecium primaurelia]|uniref:Uncharacterized protein n=1 Tax=Paramecium primaurelia TaxID=5886 RepID=A0A8S1N1E0_PARPR|nr:unnamed protein product [Paramecium primaurelia]
MEKLWFIIIKKRNIMIINIIGIKEKQLKHQKMKDICYQFESFQMRNKKKTCNFFVLESSLYGFICCQFWQL